MEKLNKLLAARALAIGLVALSGCATISSLSQTSQPPGGATQVASKPIPRVQNCGVLDAGTPSRFICNGRVYTSYQLAKLREDEARKYAVGQ
jgi:hypothetical protein